LPDLLIRNVEPQTMAELKAASTESGRSVQAEVLRILDAEMRRRRRNRDFWQRAAELRTRTAGTIQSNSADLIREDRDNDHGRA